MTVSPITTNPMGRLAANRPPFVTSGYGSRPNVGSGGSHFHAGVDMFYPHADEPMKAPWTSGSGKWSVPDAEIGRTVAALAAGDGVVVRSSMIGTGNRIRIDHGGGWETGYMHLRDRKVQVGDRVRAGQDIGTVWRNPQGTPGLNHLHWEVYRNGQTVDPEALFGRHLSALAIRNDPRGFTWLKALAMIAIAAGAGYAAYRYID